MDDKTIVTNSRGKDSTNDLKDFCDILKYELDIPNSLQNIMETVEYLERRGYQIYKNHNY